MTKHFRHWQVLRTVEEGSATSQSSIKGKPIFGWAWALSVMIPFILHSTIQVPMGKSSSAENGPYEQNRAETDVDKENAWTRFAACKKKCCFEAYINWRIKTLTFRRRIMLQCRAVGVVSACNERIKESMRRDKKRRDYQFAIVSMHQSFLMGCHLPLLVATLTAQIGRHGFEELHGVGHSFTDSHK